MLPKVSVILVTYNPIWDKLVLTLKSILSQKFTNFEIVVADDGSMNSLNELVSGFFEENGFVNYKFANSVNNVGTVRNIYNALVVSSGKYVKVISPGDMFYDDNSLKNWVNYMESQNSRVSFCDAVYYRMSGNQIDVIKKKTSPANLSLYNEPSSRNELLIDYLLANDTILGAALMMRKSTMLQYLEMIVGRVRYAEDYMVRLMVFDDIKISHVSKNLIWYEYGEGISTSSNNKWEKLLFDDFEATNQIICESNNPKDRMARKYMTFLNLHIENKYMRKIIKCVMFPSVIYWRRRAKLSEVFSPENANIQLIRRFIN